VTIEEERTLSRDWCQYNLDGANAVVLRRPQRKLLSTRFRRWLG
jgi:hypothetical protein